MILNVCLKYTACKCSQPSIKSALYDSSSYWIKLFSVQKFENIYKSDKRITEWARLLWTQIKYLVLRKFDGDSELAVKFEILTICIAGICIEYEDCDKKFLLLQQQPSRRNIAKASVSSNARLQEEPPKTFAEYHKAELQVQQAQDPFDLRLPLASRFPASPEEHKMRSIVGKLTSLWKAVVFSHYADLLLVPTILAYGPSWDPNESLLKGVLSQDLLTPQAYASIMEMAYSGKSQRVYDFEDKAMISSLTTIWRNYINDPSRVSDYDTKVIVCFRVAQIG